MSLTTKPKDADRDTAIAMRDRSKHITEYMISLFRSFKLATNGSSMVGEWRKFNHGRKLYLSSRTLSVAHHLHGLHAVWFVD